MGKREREGGRESPFSNKIPKHMRNRTPTKSTTGNEFTPEEMEMIRDYFPQIFNEIATEECISGRRRKHPEKQRGMKWST